MQALAAFPNVFVKVGGLGYARLHGCDFIDRALPSTSEQLAEGLETATSRPASTLFGPSRCMFESNFPPDKNCAVSPPACCGTLSSAWRLPIRRARRRIFLRVRQSAPIGCPRRSGSRVRAHKRLREIPSQLERAGRIGVDASGKATAGRPRRRSSRYSPAFNCRTSAERIPESPPARRLSARWMRSSYAVVVRLRSVFRRRRSASAGRRGHPPRIVRRRIGQVVRQPFVGDELRIRDAPAHLLVLVARRRCSPGPGAR